ncbi:MAG TPA: hypothetical protein VGK24_12605 [Candidatus Angelobacter sp.]|jgi:hypothetical protein
MKEKKNQSTSAGRQGILFVLDTMLEKEIFRQRHHHPCSATAPRPAEEPDQFLSTHSDIRDLLSITLRDFKTIAIAARLSLTVKLSNTVQINTQTDPIHCATF